MLILHIIAATKYAIFFYVCVNVSATFLFATKMHNKTESTKTDNSIYLHTNTMQTKIGHTRLAMKCLNALCMYAIRNSLSWKQLTTNAWELLQSEKRNKVNYVECIKIKVFVNLISDTYFWIKTFIIYEAGKIVKLYEFSQCFFKCHWILTISTYLRKNISYNSAKDGLGLLFRNQNSIPRRVTTEKHVPFPRQSGLRKRNGPGFLYDQWL